MALALVTGGNRGLGLEVCRQLLRDGFQVFLCARRECDAVQAARQLSDGAIPLELDVSDRQAVTTTLRALEYRPPLDVLINNAGVSLSGLDVDVARRTLQVNTWGAARLTDALRPKMSNSACVVMVSSAMGSVSHFGEGVARILHDPALNREQLHDLGQAFVEAVMQGTLETSGFPGNAYCVSKALLNGATRVLAREWGPNGPRINAVCPGRGRTWMGGRTAPRSVHDAASSVHDAASSVHDAASSVVWAAMLDATGPTGQFFRDGQKIAW